MEFSFFVLNTGTRKQYIMEAKPNTNAQKAYMRRHINSLSKNDMRKVGRVLVENERKNALEFYSNGTVVNLDALPAEVIEQMYDVVAECIKAFEEKIDT